MYLGDQKVRFQIFFFSIWLVKVQFLTDRITMKFALFGVCFFVCFFKGTGLCVIHITAVLNFVSQNLLLQRSTAVTERTLM